VYAKRPFESCLARPAPVLYPCDSCARRHKTGAESFVASLGCPGYCNLEGVPEAKIDLYKVVVSQIGEIITNFAENPNVGSKAIFESAADVPEDAIRSEVLTYPIYAAARDSYISTHTRRIV
jgi:hypothetical protein